MIAKAFPSTPRSVPGTLPFFSTRSSISCGIDQLVCLMSEALTENVSNALPPVSGFNWTVVPLMLEIRHTVPFFRWWRFLPSFTMSLVLKAVQPFPIPGTVSPMISGSGLRRDLGGNTLPGHSGGLGRPSLAGRCP